MNYSVIIRTKNSEKTIERCLESLGRQLMKPKDVILVDSGSTDLTLYKANKFEVKIIYYPKDEEFNYSKAINIGIKKATSDYILILSSHVEFLDKNSIGWMYKRLKANSSCITVSMVRTDNRNQITCDDIEKIKKRKITLETFSGQAMYNFCSLIRKSSWDEYHFNENLLRCEDQEWAYNFLNKNFFTEIILKPNIYYKNPYYNKQKDIWDMITLGETIYPYYISNKYLIKLIKEGIKEYLNGNKIKSYYNFNIFSGIFRHKYFNKVNIKSIYNKNLK